MKQAKSAKRIREASHAGSWYTDQGTSFRVPLRSSRSFLQDASFFYLAKKSPVLLLTQGLPYAPTGATLAEQLEGWLAAVETSNDSSAPSRALISPYVPPSPQTQPTRAHVPDAAVPWVVWRAGEQARGLLLLGPHRRLGLSRHRPVHHVRHHDRLSLSACRVVCHVWRVWRVVCHVRVSCVRSCACGTRTNREW